MTVDPTNVTDKAAALVSATAAAWAATTLPILKDQLAFESDTNKFKIGDGVSVYSALSYVTSGGGVLVAQNGVVFSTTASELNFVGGSVTESGGVVTVPLRDTVSVTAQWVSPSVVANGTYILMYKTPYAGTITSLDYSTGSGSFTAEITINGTAVTGLSAVTVSSATATNVVATGTNTFIAGSQILLIISGVSGSPSDALLNLNLKWS